MFPFSLRPGINNCQSQTTVPQNFRILKLCIAQFTLCSKDLVSAIEKPLDYICLGSFPARKKVPHQSWCLSHLATPRQNLSWLYSEAACHLIDQRTRIDENRVKVQSIANTLILSFEMFQERNHFCNFRSFLAKNYRAFLRQWVDWTKLTRIDDRRLKLKPAERRTNLNETQLK